MVIKYVVYVIIHAELHAGYSTHRRVLDHSMLIAITCDKCSIYPGEIIYISV